MRGKRLVLNTLLLSSGTLLLKTIGLMFQVMLSKKMGAAGIGLFQLIMSVNSFAATVAISGIRFATTRLVSEELGRGRQDNIPNIVKRCIIYAVLCGTATSLALYSSAGTISARLLGDSRAELSLRILCFSMPFLSAGASLSGYFIGVSRIMSSVTASVAEQIFKVVISALLLGFVNEGDVQMTCAAVSVGGISGEILSFLLIYILYKFDARKYNGRAITEHGIPGRIVKIAVPLAVSAYARTALNTLQNVLIPKGFQRSGASSEASLADYGTIQGMVFPIITYPAVLFGAVSELIVPELTKDQVRGREDAISSAANMLLKLCLVFSVFVMGVFLSLSNLFGVSIYNSVEVGKYIRLFAMLMPVMYMDTITDGLLRGLGEQLYSMRINIIDSLICTILIYFLLPRYAIYGYIFILYASEIFNFSLSIYKLTRITKIENPIICIVKTLAAIFGAINITEYLFVKTHVIAATQSIIIGIIVMLSIYLTIILLLNTFSIKEFRLIKRAMKS